MIKVGLIGYGYWAELARNLADTEGVELVAIAEARPDRRGRRLDIIRATSMVADAADLIKRDDLDAVVTPLHTHCAAAAAIERGLHVLIEKPLAASKRRSRSPSSPTSTASAWWSITPSSILVLFERSAGSSIPASWATCCIWTRCE
jgi:hypothetical protein